MHSVFPFELWNLLVIRQLVARLSIAIAPWFVLFCLLCSASASGQYHFEQREFGPGNGYKHGGSISDIGIDRSGQIWIVRFGGVSRFDGARFSDIEDSEANSAAYIRFYESAKGQPFLLDHHNQILFIRNDSLVPCRFSDTIMKITGQSSIMDVKIDKQNQIHLSVRGRHYFVIDSVGHISEPLEALSKKMKGMVHILSEDGPFTVLGRRRRFEGDSLDSVYILNADLELIEKAPFRMDGLSFMPSTVKLSNGNFLSASGEAEIIEYNDSGIVRIYANEFAVFRMLVDRSNNLWVSTLRNGIHFYPDQTLSLENRAVVTDKEYTSAAVAEDFQGGIWVYSENKGLSRIERSYAKQFFKEIGMKSGEKLVTVSARNNDVVMGTYNRMLPSYNIKTKEQTELNYSSPNNSLIEIRFDRQNKKDLWASQWGGIAHYTDDTWHQISIDTLEQTANFPHNRAYYITDEENPDVRFTCSMLDGYIRIKDTSISYVSPRFPSRIYGILTIGDSTWVTTHAGLYLQRNDTIIDMKLVDPEMGAAFPQMKFFQGKIWLMSISNGAFILDNDGLHHLTHEGKDLTNPLIFRYKSGELWVSAKEGLFQFSSLKEENHFSHTHLSIYPPFPMSGIRSFSTTDSAIFLAWEEKGLVVIAIEDMLNRPFQVPDLRIQHITINDSLCPPDARSFELNHDENFINISYIGLNYTESEVIYRYRMPGFTDDWKETTERSLQFLRLPPGDYDIELQAQLEHQPWSESQYLHFSIAKPFWTTWWFISSGLLLLSGVIAFLIRLRFKRQQRDQQLTIQRITAEQHALHAQLDSHYLFNVMASVQYLVMEGNSTRTITFLNMFTRLLRSTLDHTRSDGLTISEEIAFLNDYLAMEQFRLEHRFEYIIEQSTISGWLDQTIPAFILQPFVENAINHGLKNKMDHGQLSIRFTPENDFLKVIITDDGVGREAAAHFRKSNGAAARASHSTNIIQERLELYNGRGENVAVKDLKTTEGDALGTQVTIRIKLEKP